MTTVRTTSELQHFVQQRTLSQAAFERAKKVMPSGVAHDLRYVAPFPITLARASGARKWDLDGNEYIDFHFGSAALLLGHAHPDVVAAMVEAAQRGYHYAQAHPLEPEWGELIQRLVPSVERLRFVNSGTEATYLAMRVARAYTGKPKILRFEGHYHGWHDYSVVGMSPPFDKPTSTGIPEALFESMVIVPANDPAAVERALDADSEIGTVIVEASGSSWSTVPLKPGFLQALRDITTKRSKVLIFDEVITGFRWSKGGAQVK
ncbi:MAG: aminotransferase class III-fold pyridoxal phosphate-dependent enzyme, partial [Chloroflexi bacterium]|nr:aminotransferase class III-fold pyridoxal phosphate-dependent enzyme [Chloroflexota bacterium]